MTRNCLLAFFLLALARAAGAGPGEAVVTKARGAVLSVDKGADDGLVVGMEVVVVRPPGEAVIHPITGENLGAPQIRLGTGEVAKVSAKSGVVRLKESPLMAVRPGDVIRFVASEMTPKAAAEQERLEVEKKEEAQERQQLKTDVSGLARDLKSIQGTIRTLENMMQRLEKVDESLKAQMRGIATDVNALKREMKEIRAMVMAVPVEKMKGEAAADTLTPAQLARLRQIIQEEIQTLQAQAQPQAAPETTAAAEPQVAQEEPAPEEPAPEEPAPEEPAAPLVPPFYTTTWFMYGVGGLGVLIILYYVFRWLKSRPGKEDEEEDEEEEEKEVEVDEVEEDDIVVEESK